MLWSGIWDIRQVDLVVTSLNMQFKRWRSLHINAHHRLISRRNTTTIPWSPTPTNHFPSGLHSICDEAKCVSLLGSEVGGEAMCCGCSGLIGSSVAERMFEAAALTEASCAAEVELLELFVLRAGALDVSVSCQSRDRWCLIAAWRVQEHTTGSITAYTCISPETSKSTEALFFETVFDCFLPSAFAFPDDVLAFFTLLQIPKVKL